MRSEIIRDENGDLILLIPDEICAELELEIGDTMVFCEIEDGGFCLRKVDVRDWRYFAQ